MMTQRYIFYVTGVQLNAESYKSILYLIAGGESWLTPYEHLPVPWPLEAKRREVVAANDRASFDVRLHAMGA